MRTSIWLVRHGQTKLNQQRRYQGSSDSPLTAYGSAQVAGLARRLQRIPFGIAIVSPSGHTQASAAAILAGRSVPVSVDTDWAEQGQGNWEGLTYREVVRRFPQEAMQRFSDPLDGRATGGESLADVQQRVHAGWQRIQNQYPGGRILVVTHALPIQLILCATSGLPIAQHWRWRVDLGSLTAIDVYAAGPIVRVVNEVVRLN